ncbi:MAG TPA: hypothetical protein VM221_01870 [Armatimonadota bacterium]|nr:hypothetical protein [Armatimonadota bacterium]
MSCGRALDYAPPDVDVGGWVKRGWDVFVNNIGPSIAIPLVMLVPLIGLGILVYVGIIGAVITADAVGARGEKIALAAMGSLFGLLGLFVAFLMPALLGGIYACFLAGARTGKVTAAHLGDGFRQWWACTWVCWVLGAASLVALPFTLVLIGLPVLYGIQSLLWLALMRIVDTRRGGMDALDFAWNAMRGRLWMMLLFTFLMTTLMNAGVSAMYLGALVTTPIATAALAAGYDALSRK